MSALPALRRHGTAATSLSTFMFFSTGFGSAFQHSQLFLTDLHDSSHMQPQGWLIIGLSM